MALGSNAVNPKLLGCWGCNGTNKGVLCAKCVDARRCKHGHFGNCSECVKKTFVEAAKGSGPSVTRGK